MRYGPGKEQRADHIIIAERAGWRGAAFVRGQDIGNTNGQDMGYTLAKTSVTVMAKTSVTARPLWH